MERKYTSLASQVPVVSMSLLTDIISLLSGRGELVHGGLESTLGWPSQVSKRIGRSLLTDITSLLSASTLHWRPKYQRALDVGLSSRILRLF